ncbi:hypothetical protein N9K16_02305 [Alphaproteobacteria bacterium]|nr:hypothetical protein [Alphaproteobacteria bacterium]
MWGLSTRNFVITLTSLVLLSLNAQAFDGVTDGNTPKLAHFEKLQSPGRHGVQVVATSNWLTGQNLIDLVTRGPLQITHLDGTPYGVMRASPGGRAVWKPASIYNSALHGNWVVVGSNLCFDYNNSAQQYCYLYHNSGSGKITGYHQGQPNHIIWATASASTSVIGQSKPARVRDCSVSQQTYCGPSICQGNICTRDYVCRCEYNGLPVWKRY